MVSKTKKNIDFEASLQQLEAIVEKMDNQNLPLDQALDHFERGVALTKNCQSALDAAEQKIRTITANSKSDDEL